MSKTFGGCKARFIGVRYFIANDKAMRYVNRRRRIDYGKGPFRIRSMTSYVKNTRKVRKLLRAAIRELVSISHKPIDNEVFFVGPFDGR